MSLVLTSLFVYSLKHTIEGVSGEWSLVFQRLLFRSPLSGRYCGGRHLQRSLRASHPVALLRWKSILRCRYLSSHQSPVGRSGLPHSRRSSAFGGWGSCPVSGRLYISSFSRMPLDVSYTFPAGSGCAKACPLPEPLRWISFLLH